MITLKRSIALVGLMGAGKSSVGRKLAESLGVPFQDSDDEIEKAAGMSIPEIFETYGEPEFRGVERRVIARLVQERPQIISTGGGAFAQDDVRGDIREFGVSVWLDADIDTLWKRVEDKPGRPLLNTDNPRETLARLLKIRAPAYAQADFTIRTRSNDNQENVARKIVKTIRAHDAAHPERAIFKEGAA